MTTVIIEQDSGERRIAASELPLVIGGDDADIPVSGTSESTPRAFIGIEANEAFSAQAIAVARDLNFDMDKVNVNGGAIALGHPVGASGARILVTLIHELKRRDLQYGLATLCVGGGMGVSMIVENCLQTTK